jgi:formylglycine-generating enzyme required for sulfatase activity
MAAVPPDFFELLRQSGVLEEKKMVKAEFELRPHFRAPHALAAEMLRLGWLTAYQIDTVAAGNGRELVLGNYVLREPLKSGGMGQVFIARHSYLDSIVALKVIRPELVSHPGFLERFRLEARLLAKMTHPNVIRVNDAGEAAGTHFLVMEYIEGLDLERLVRLSGRLPPQQAVEYVRQAALGLAEIHKAGLVHRDVKPGNLMLASDGVVKVLDLGIARQDYNDPALATCTVLTGMEVVMGTPDYMAPEQTLDARAVTAQSDLYSLGCTLYHLLTGDVPFPGGGRGDKARKQREEEPPALTERRPEATAPLAAVVHKLMAKQPEQRFQTAEEVARILERFALPRPAFPLLPPLINSAGMSLVFIPPGKFLMGSPESEAGRDDHEGPPREVEITQGFYMGACPVTQEQYERVMRTTPSRFASRGRGAGMDAGRFPVESVSWEDARAFCTALSEMPEEKRQNRKYRLPTEAEWEYACRAGSSTAFPFGPNLSSSQANFDGEEPYGDASKGPCLGRPSPVAAYDPNGFGLYDTCGNVCEWCADWYASGYYRVGPREDPHGPEGGAARVLRGGSFLFPGRFCRSAFRGKLAPAFRSDDTGFRVAMVLGRTTA